MSGGKIYKYILRNYKTDLTHAMHDMALVGYLQRLWVFFCQLEIQYSYYHSTKVLVRTRIV